MIIFFKMFLVPGMFGMKKKSKEEQVEEDKKNLLDVESVSNTSQEGIELRSSAQLMDAEMNDGKDEKEKGEWGGFAGFIVHFRDWD